MSFTPRAHWLVYFQTAILALQSVVGSDLKPKEIEVAVVSADHRKYVVRAWRKRAPVCWCVLVFSFDFWSDHHSVMCVLFVVRFCESAAVLCLLCGPLILADSRC